MFVFNTINYIYSQCKSPFTPKSVLNKPQTEGRVNQVCTVEKFQHSSAQLLVYIKSFLLINMVELDHQSSAANTLVNIMGLDMCVV